MSSVTIITSIIVLLAALLCYAFIAQTVNQKRQQRERLLQAMRTRARNFKFMLSGFPAGFLPKELTLLVQRSLIDVLETLTKLEPKNSAHADDLLAVTQQVSETQRATANPQHPGSIDNPQQVREVKACLEELYKFVFYLEGKRRMSRQQADGYRALIKQLVLQLTVDSYVLHGRVARDKNKLRLALHYFDLALKLMARERNSGLFDKRIAQLQTLVAELNAKQASEGQEAVTAQTNDGESTISEEWDEFEKEEKGWKKKQIYD